jgi:methylase of polypeptide subunit release factors
LRHEQYTHEPSISAEPITALVANESGLALYRALLIQLASWEHIHKHTMITLYFEIDPSQTTALRHMIHTYFQEATIHVHQDLAHNDRIVQSIITP